MFLKRKKKKVVEEEKIEFEGFKYKWHDETRLKMARDMSIRQGTLGSHFTAALITEVLHLRSKLLKVSE